MVFEFFYLVFCFFFEIFNEKVKFIRINCICKYEILLYYYIVFVIFFIELVIFINFAVLDF